ncbi:MAG: type IV pilin N-terminal domain-containing protein [Methanolinea sp.]|nr:type IV pilin N-terminal domain-containing protein [Methanolinea sp.]
MKFIKDEEAVSPVIGVILMVAITVILAAVIAAFVFGLAGTTGSSKNVGITAVKSGDQNFIITIQGGSDLPQLNKLEYSTNGTTYVEISKPTAGWTVGAAATVTGYNGTSPTNTGVRLIIKGTFTDGSQQVLWDRTF